MLLLHFLAQKLLLSVCPSSKQMTSHKCLGPKSGGRAWLRCPVFIGPTWSKRKPIQSLHDFCDDQCCSVYIPIQYMDMRSWIFWRLGCWCFRYWSCLLVSTLEAVTVKIMVLICAHHNEYNFNRGASRLGGGMREQAVSSLWICVKVIDYGGTTI